MTNLPVFECKKSSNDILNDDTTRPDEVVVCHVPPRYLFPKNTHESKKFVNKNKKSNSPRLKFHDKILHLLVKVYYIKKRIKEYEIMIVNVLSVMF